MPSTRSSDVGRNLAWRVNGGDWILFHKRRRMGRVVPDGQHRGMFRVALPSGRLSDLGNLSRAKDSALAAAERELEFEDRERRANDPRKCPVNGGLFSASSPPIAPIDPAGGLQPDRGETLPARFRRGAQ
jgi:hypothetical protein